MHKGELRIAIEASPLVLNSKNAIKRGRLIRLPVSLTARHSIPSSYRGEEYVDLLTKSGIGIL